MLNVFITGAAGFIGGVLARQCTQDGASVLGIDVGGARCPLGRLCL